MPRPGQPFLGVRVIVEVPEKELSTGPIIEGFALMKRKGGGVEFLKLPLWEVSESGVGVPLEIVMHTPPLTLVELHPFWNEIGIPVVDVVPVML
jgi:hypothetical protein